MWAPDTRQPKINYRRLYPQGLTEAEKWIEKILDPVMCRKFPSLQLFLPSGKVFGESAPIARLAAYFAAEGEEEREDGIKSIKEIFKRY